VELLAPHPAADLLNATEEGCGRGVAFEALVCRRSHTVDQHVRRVQGMLVLIQGDDEAKFCEALIALGYERGSERFEHFASAWRSLKRRRA